VPRTAIAYFNFKSAAKHPHPDHHNLAMSDKPSKPTSSAGGTPAASTPAASSSKIDEDIEKLLNREASAFQREVEVERILKAFKLKYVVKFSFKTYHTNRP
jgi:hypothetical protein